MQEQYWMSRALLVCAAGVGLGSAALAADPRWAYSGAGGPESWGQLDAKFSLCATGKNQSPIDLVSLVEVDLPAIGFAYAPGGGEIVNDGHTVQVNFSGGGVITVAGQTFELRQFHFHLPSENHIRGKSFPMEAHFVHADSAGHLAVIGVMFIEGAVNPALEPLWSHMPADAGPPRPLPSPISAAALLPPERDYYSFAGSLTTPPCTEGVRWLLLKQPVTASKAQIDALRQTLRYPNNRPVQPVNARLVEE